MLRDRKGSYPGNVRLASWALASVMVLWSFSGVAMAGFAVPPKGRVALVVGNSAYEPGPPVANAGNDATAMTEALRTVGFNVILGVDLDRSGFFEKLKEFSLATKDASVALFFYAGRASPYRWDYYLAPTDAEFERPIHYNEWHIKLADVIGFMQSKTKLVFLDASRIDLFGRALAPRELAWEEGGGWTFIAYATSMGSNAHDGPKGGYSPFTHELLQYIGLWAVESLPGLGMGTRLRTPTSKSLGEIMGLVIDSVRKSTDGQQIPTVSSSGNPFSFYFDVEE